MSHPSLSIERVRFEHHPTGYGVPSGTPRFSWRYSCPGETISNWSQTAYEVEVRRAGQTERHEIEGSSSSFNPWPDAPLRSRETAELRVRGKGVHRQLSVGGFQPIVNTSVSSEWSPWSAVEAGLLAQEDWRADFITGAKNESSERWVGGTTGIRPIRLRKTFELPSDLDLKDGIARLYVTALGLYEAYLNGQRVGAELMTPGWTSYGHRLHYQRYDVTSLLESGGRKNTLALEVAEGWYAGRLAWGDGQSHVWGDRIAASAQLEIFKTRADSTPTFQLLTDETWSACPSALIASGIYDGETYDLGLEDAEWKHGERSTTATTLKSDWRAVELLPRPQARLSASSFAGVYAVEKFRPVRIFSSASGKTLLDFGQNLVGKLHIQAHLRRTSGHRLQFRHAEVLEDGEIATRPLRSANATDTVIFGGDCELKDWSPRFTFHGFRYAEVEGWGPEDRESPLTTDSISALVMHNNMERTGHFECSDKLVNKLHTNVVWSMRGNFLAVPTDCPQRDERLGWTGDLNVFSPTASFLYDCLGMLSNYMEDLVVDQRDWDGVVPLVVPNCLVRGPIQKIPQAIWSDIIVMLPWTLYNSFGDVEVLRQSYSGMCAHLDDALPRAVDGLWSEDVYQLGDWLDPNAPPDNAGLARTDPALVADEYLVYVTGIMKEVATVLGLDDDAARYDAEHRHLKAMFQNKYVAPSGLIVGDSQTSLALASTFHLHGDGYGGKEAASPSREILQRSTAAARLARHVRFAKFHVSTGFAGTPVVLHALSSTGHLQLAYRMLLEQGCPSWLYPVTMGATTIWERWDSLLPDGRVNPGDMTSFNHYALGAVADWLHSVVGGIRPTKPGWTEFRVEPRPGGTITSAKVAFLSSCGWVKCEWELRGIDDGATHESAGPRSEASKPRFVLKLTVPPNSAAVVVLPDGKGEPNREGRRVGSGDYDFECEYRAEGEWPPKPLLTFPGDEVLKPD